jgi:transcription initiation factor IIF auxiliary subunit
VLISYFSDKPSEMEGFPMKSWNIEVYLLDEAGNEKPANCFTKAVYNLHPSFANPIQSECAASRGREVVLTAYTSSFP